MASDHIDPNVLTRPNSEMMGGFVVFFNGASGYSLSIDLTSITDEDGLPATGDGEKLASKIVWTITGVPDVALVSDESQVIGGFEVTYVSAESLG